MPSSALARLECLLLDMDGTVYIGANPIDGAAEFIAFLRETGRRFVFFTNNPSADAAAYSEKLKAMGIDAAPEDILTAGEATVRYLLSRTPYRRVYVLGTPSFECEVRRAGLELTEEEPDAVILSFDKTLTYAKLERACHLLRDGLPYIATNPDLVCPVEDGYIPDCGAMAALIEAATGRTPVYVGKPNAMMVQMGMEKLGAAPAATAMVGDRLYTDMEMAYRAGITSVLVLSGETRPEDVQGAERKPDFVFPSVRELKTAMAVRD